MEASGYHPETLQPWQRQADESSKAFAAFEAYCQAGASRSIARVSRTLSKSRPLLTRWSRRHRWRERTLEWDQHQGKRVAEEIVSGVAEMRSRQIIAALEL